jgi:hypothetical protein
MGCIFSNTECLKSCQFLSLSICFRPSPTFASVGFIVARPWLVTMSSNASHAIGVHDARSTFVLNAQNVSYICRNASGCRTQCCHSRRSTLAHQNNQCMPDAWSSATHITCPYEIAALLARESGYEGLQLTLHINMHRTPFRTLLIRPCQRDTCHLLPIRVRKRERGPRQTTWRWIRPQRLGKQP